MFRTLIRPQTVRLARTPLFRNQGRSSLKLMGIATISLGVVSIYKPIYNDTLKPDPTGDTFEMGLYIASQKELQVEREVYRNKKLEGNLIKVFFNKIRFWIEDYICSPLHTLERFVQLSCIFIPVLLLSPICYFGKHKSGAKLWYRMLRYSLELAGASFIKLGQWAGSRTDIFTQECCEELSFLHSKAKAHSLAYSKKVIEESFDLPFEEIFEEFRGPLGVGAIAQVYCGKLSDKMVEKVGDHVEERWVAVKVVHPKAAVNIDRDLKIMSFFANTIDMIPTMEWLSLPDEVEQFSMLMKLQLDLRIEGQNLVRFRDNFKSHANIKFPASYFSSRQVLFEEYIHGLPMAKILELKGNGMLKKSIAKQVSDPFIDSFLQMLILDDFIHADLHPGNVLLRFIKMDRSETHVTSTEADSTKISSDLLKLSSSSDQNEQLCEALENIVAQGYVPQVCFLDVGLVTELNEVNRVNFIALFNALAQFDGYQAGELMIERSRTPETAIDKELFALKVERLVSKVKKRTFTLGTVQIGDLLDQMLGMVRGHHVRMEGDFVSVIVAILLLEGIGRQLDSELDLFARFVLYTLVNGFEKY